MPASPPFDSQRIRPPGGTTTRARASADNTAQPPLTSGFGAVMEQEVDIQSSTEQCLETEAGPLSAALERVLRQQGRRLGANIALLEQRYEMLPHPARFHTLHARHGPLSLTRQAAVSDAGGVLPSLVAQHLDLLRKIETLIHQRPDGQRGALILAEIARNHEEMASRLSALIKENAVHDVVPVPVLALHAPPPEATPPEATGREAEWENEGGAPSRLPPHVG